MAKLNSLIAEEARRWVVVKVKYQHRGMTMRGCDCGGFVLGVLNKFSIKPLVLPHYSQNWGIHIESNELITNGLNIIASEVDKAETGDILVFKFGKYHCHAGIYLGNNTFAHCYEAGRHCRLGVLNNSAWGRKLRKVFRINETQFLAKE